MAILAMGFTPIDCRRPFAAAKILSDGHRLKMIGIDTCPIAAEMVDLQPIRDGPACSLINGTVGV